MFLNYLFWSSLSSRFWWRPPSKGVFSQVLTKVSASSGVVVLPPRQRMLALLWAAAISAVNLSWTRAARMPFVRLAFMEIPMPVPQIRMALSTSPKPILSTAFWAISG